MEKPNDDLPRIIQEISKSKGLKRDKQYEKTPKPSTGILKRNTIISIKSYP
jgi:hypothetical protein